VARLGVARLERGFLPLLMLAECVVAFRCASSGRVWCRRRSFLAGATGPPCGWLLRRSVIFCVFMTPRRSVGPACVAACGGTRAARSGASGVGSAAALARSLRSSISAHEYGAFGACQRKLEAAA